MQLPENLCRIISTSPPEQFFGLLFIGKLCPGNEVGIMWKIVLSLRTMKGSIPFYWGVQSCRYKVSSCQMPFMKANPHRILDQKSRNHIYHKIKPRDLLKKMDTRQLPMQNLQSLHRKDWVLLSSNPTKLPKHISLAFTTTLNKTVIKTWLS